MATQQGKWFFGIINLAQTTMKLQGLRQGNIAAAMSRGMYEFAEQVMTRAKELCPVDTGALKSTGHVQQPEVRGTEIRVTLGFGGVAGKGFVKSTKGSSWVTGRGSAKVGYATYVHEDLKARHVNGQAKFLESPLLEAMKQFDSKVMGSVQRMLEQKMR